MPSSAVIREASPSSQWEQIQRPTTELDKAEVPRECALLTLVPTCVSYTGLPTPSSGWSTDIDKWGQKSTGCSFFSWDYAALRLLQYRDPLLRSANPLPSLCSI